MGGLFTLLLLTFDAQMFLIQMKFKLSLAACAFGVPATPSTMHLFPCAPP
jgi:hypothetical protein